ncbi:hypothetical protein METBIDRAFT_85189 [Metschnikowia bicuspidata var. bicuspidata NRRL YB-4993]|uniref:Glutaredoxin domain-containing protein n=1 Tax=Metschnikowia bicuspidata var. bicuspidata NRRL YB-4993 TaxID=869754 RepID=A0A1A0HFL8_9ASCO|nr:hypothetical protein METBIDRAFT_85189 [Metschnikowia bicuspidata var. bicuspidata NRRL YB-4993]OBA22796.1 hypothetical protein METBIDRAFT_85189 [Metschnikowia bicuspidata var. bicuspidata NRRL YB-4993]
MANGKKSKVLALALALLLVFVILIRGRGAYDWASAPAGTVPAAKSLLDSQNNEVVDNAINQEISREKIKEETGGGAGENTDSGDVEPLDYDPSKEFLQIRALAPMTIFSKTYCPYLKQLKKLLLENYSITPAPQIVELDKHKHGRELQEYVGHVSERNTVPNVIIGTELTLSKGGASEFTKLHKEGKLVEMLKLWGGKAISVLRLEVPSNS